MALRPFGLRRAALASLSTAHRHQGSSFSSRIVPAAPSIFQSVGSSPLFRSPPFAAPVGSARWFSQQQKQYKLYKEGDEITEDTVLFEGCDFNHWLITVDFPRDNKPKPEEMVATYERICAQGLNISIEEAKKKIYACSTTTYEGFQAIMTEEESEKFKDVPGVVFVLPDSYIDPANKQYGGDKYENGVITPRPPPVQYQRGGRFRDRNRNVYQPRYDRQIDHRNYGPQPDPPQWQNYGPSQNFPPQQTNSPPQTFPGQQNYGPSQNLPPPQNYGPRQTYQPQQSHVAHQDYPAQQTQGPPGQVGMGPMNNHYQATPRGPLPSYQGRYNQVQQGNSYTPDQRDFPQGGQRDIGFSEQRDLRGDNRNYSAMYGGNEQGDGQDYSREHQRFSQVEQTNKQDVQGNYWPMGQTGTEQGRY